MQTKNMRKNLTAGCAVIITLMMASLAIPTAYASEIPEDANIEDHGDFWGLHMYFIFAGADAESIEWDFGDGSPISTDWNTSHIYEVGEYIVTQTVYNSFNGGSSATGYYRINVCGAPYVDLIQPEGAPSIENVYAYIDLDGSDLDAHRTIIQPENPVWDGYTFEGWYADEELTVPFDWNQKLQAPTTAYASYAGVVPGVDQHSLVIKGEDGEIIQTLKVENGKMAKMPTAPEGKTVKYYTDSAKTVEFDWTTPITSNMTIYKVVTDATVTDDGDHLIPLDGVSIVLVASTILIGIIAIATRNPTVALIAVIIASIAALGIFEVIDLSEIFKGGKL